MSTLEQSLRRHRVVARCRNCRHQSGSVGAAGDRHVLGRNISRDERVLIQIFNNPGNTRDAAAASHVVDGEINHGARLLVGYNNCGETTVTTVTMKHVQSSRLRVARETLRLGSIGGVLIAKVNHRKHKFLTSHTLQGCQREALTNYASRPEMNGGQMRNYFVTNPKVSDTA